MEERIFVTKWELGDAWQVLGLDDQLSSELTWVPGFLSLRMEMGGPSRGSSWWDGLGGSERQSRTSRAHFSAGRI